MLRLLFVFVVLAAGAYYSTQGAFYVLLLYLWNGYFRPEDWVWHPIIFQLRLSLVIGAALVVTSISSLGRFRLTTGTLLILLFCAQGAAARLVAPWGEVGMYFWVEFLKVAFVTLLITVLVDDRRKFRLALVVIAFSLGLEAAKQGWAQMVLNTGAPNNNPHMVLGDRNGVAMGMMMLVPIFIALAKTASTRWERRVHQFFLVGVLYRGVSTYSRGGLLSAATIGLMALAGAKRRLGAVVVMACLAVGAFALMPHQFWDRMATITAGDDDRDASAQGRLYFWGLALDMATDHPLTGVGFNAYRYAFDRYDVTGGVHGSQRAVHSAWFGLVADLGFPGLIIFAALVVWTWFQTRQVKQEASQKNLPDLATYAYSLQMSLVAFLVGATFLSVQYLEMVWHLFGLSIALTHIVRTAQTDVTSTDPARPFGDGPGRRSAAACARSTEPPVRLGVFDGLRPPPDR